MRALALVLSLGLVACDSGARDPQLQRALRKSLGDARPEMRLVSQDATMICGEVRANKARPQAAFRAFVLIRPNSLYLEGEPGVNGDPVKFNQILRSLCPNGARLSRRFIDRHPDAA